MHSEPGDRQELLAQHGPQIQVPALRESHSDGCGRLRLHRSRRAAGAQQVLLEGEERGKHASLLSRIEIQV